MIGNMITKIYPKYLILWELHHFKSANQTDCYNFRIWRPTVKFWYTKENRQKLVLKKNVYTTADTTRGCCLEQFIWQLNQLKSNLISLAVFRFKIEVEPTAGYK